jgi:hypothetical protein
MMSLYYLSRQLIDVLAALEENGQAMMAIENRSVRPGLQGTRFTGKKREFYQVAWLSAEHLELHWVDNIFRMREAQSRSRRVHLVLHTIVGKPGTGYLGRSADRRQPPQQEEVMAAKGAAIGPENPVDGLLHDVANAYASKID